MNGGSRCYVMRVTPQNAVYAVSEVPAGECAVVRMNAKNPGLWGNELEVTFSPAGKAKTQLCQAEGRTDENLITEIMVSTFEFNLEVRYRDIIENYDNLSFNRQAPNYVEKQLEKSELITISYIGTEAGAEMSDPKHPFAELARGNEANVKAGFSGGSDGNIRAMAAADFIGNDEGAGKRSGIQAFWDNDEVSIIAVPGVTDPGVQLALTAHCEKQAGRFAVLDVPREAKDVQDIMDYRINFDSSYAALYHPWLFFFDPLEKGNRVFPPSGSVMGIYARTDNSRGVHKAPANEVVRACTALDIQFGKGEQDILNPKGVNLIRAFPGQGIRVWGARTVSSDANWKYVNVRRLFIFIESSIKALTGWVIFEPNDETLWVRVKSTVEMFLTGLWRAGALAGSTPDEAFFVKIGVSTMTQEDIDNGRLVCVIGVAPVKPAEFVIFRITKKKGDTL